MREDRKEVMPSEREEKGVRINKFLSEAGVCSRREGDRMLLQGRICIDGIPAVPGSRVLPGQKVTVDHKTVEKEKEEIYLAFYKPRGIVCTTADRENGEIIQNVIDYIQYPKRVFPVGRLDQASEGLLLLTNQGHISEKIQRGRYNHEKEYLVKVHKKLTSEFLRDMAKGVPILDTVTKPCQIKKVDDYHFRIILTQGLNRQIRRMCDYFKYQVVLLRRERVMSITLDGLVKGRYRELSEAEVAELKRQLDQK